MDLQLLIVIALVALSAVYLACRMFGSLVSKAPAHCAGCSLLPSCERSAARCAETSAPPPAPPADNRVSAGRPFVA